VTTRKSSEKRGDFTLNDSAIATAEEQLATLLDSFGDASGNGSSSSSEEDDNSISSRSTTTIISSARKTKTTNLRSKRQQYQGCASDSGSGSDNDDAAVILRALALSSASESRPQARRAKRSDRITSREKSAQESVEAYDLAPLVNILVGDNDSDDDNAELNGSTERSKQPQYSSRQRSRKTNTTSKNRMRKAK